MVRHWTLIQSVLLLWWHGWRLTELGLYKPKIPTSAHSTTETELHILKLDIHVDMQNILFSQKPGGQLVQP